MKLVNYTTYQRHIDMINDDWKSFKSQCIKNDIDGVELMINSNYSLKKLPKNFVKGVHLTYWPSWIDTYKKNDDQLLKFFLTKKNLIEHLNDFSIEKMQDWLRYEVEQSHLINAQYMVHHVSNIGYLEAITKNYRYSDCEVLDYSVEFINKTFPKKMKPKLIFENLWWPGLNFGSIHLTEKFLDKIKVENVGLALDLSHLMIYCGDSERQFDKKVKELEKLKDYIDVIHINKSNGIKFFSNNHEDILNKVLQSNSLDDRYNILYRHIQKIDDHALFLEKKLKDIISSLNPTYKVIETTYENLEELFLKINNQTEYIYQNSTVG